MVNPISPQSVESGDILKTLGNRASVSLSPMTGLQQAGVWIAAGIGIVGFLVLVLLIGVWTSNIPPKPTFIVQNSASNPTSITDTAKTLENYKYLTDMAAQQPLSLIDSVIAKIIVPLFTLVLGYVFGARQSKE